MIDQAFWQGKRVFITGHTGFKGSWLSLWLSSLGVEVKGYALSPPTSPSLFDEAKVGNRSDLFNYFVENRLSQLLDNIGDF